FSTYGSSRSGSRVVSSITFPNPFASHINVNAAGPAARFRQIISPLEYANSPRIGTLSDPTRYAVDKSRSAGATPFLNTRNRSICTLCGGPKNHPAGPPGLYEHFPGTPIS